jgi:hypothetical protein
MPLVRIGDLLIEAGVITREQLATALREQAVSGGRLGSKLVELGFVDEKTIASLLARQLNIPSATANQIDRVPSEVVRMVPALYAERHRAIPIRDDKGRLWVAMADPTDRFALDELKRVCGREIRPMVAPEILIKQALERYYHAKRRVKDDAPAPPPPPQSMTPSRHDAPLYQPFPTVDALTSATGFLDEAAPAPPTQPLRIGALTMEELALQLVGASSDEAILELAMRWLLQEVPRVWVLLLQEGELCSWGGRGLDAAPFQGLRVRPDDLPVVARALASGSTFVGMLSAVSLGALAAPLGAVGDVPGIVLPVRLGKHPVGCIFGMGATVQTVQRKPELDRFALKLDQALHIGYLRRALLAP